VRWRYCNLNVCTEDSCGEDLFGNAFANVMQADIVSGYVPTHTPNFPISQQVDRYAKLSAW